MKTKQRRETRRPLVLERLESKTLLSTASVHALARSHPRAEAFVASLYTTYLNRPPSPAGESYWLHELHTGVSTSQVTNTFQFSVERLRLLATWPIRKRDTFNPPGLVGRGGYRFCEGNPCLIGDRTSAIKPTSGKTGGPHTPAAH